jgi:hypothetical protein
MRIITDENVDQLLSMSYSNNISKLLHKPETRNTTDNKIMVMNYVRTMNKDSLRKPDETDDRAKIPNTPEFPTPLEEHDIESKSPEYVQQESNTSLSPEYVHQGSPAYNPSGSPAYNPSGSPAYNPSGSPAYNPSLSPEYVQQGSPATDGIQPAPQPAPQPETPSTSVTPAENISPPPPSILNVQEDEKTEVETNKIDSSEIKKIDISNTTI